MAWTEIRDLRQRRWRPGHEEERLWSHFVDLDLKDLK